MRIGVPKEIKNHEYRVGLVPSSVRELVAHGHEVVVETHAGYGIGLDDDRYEAAGATILSTPENLVIHPAVQVNRYLYVIATLATGALGALIFLCRVAAKQRVKQAETVG